MANSFNSPITDCKRKKSCIGTIRHETVAYSQRVHHYSLFLSAVICCAKFSKGSQTEMSDGNSPVWQRVRDGNKLSCMTWLRVPHSPLCNQHRCPHLILCEEHPPPPHTRTHTHTRPCLMIFVGTCHWHNAFPTDLYSNLNLHNKMDSLNPDPKHYVNSLYPALLRPHRVVRPSSTVGS